MGHRLSVGGVTYCEGDIREFAVARVSFIDKALFEIDSDEPKPGVLASQPGCLGASAAAEVENS